MHIITSLAIMLLPFGAFLLVIGKKSLSGAGNQGYFPSNTINLALTSEQLDVIADALEFTNEYIEHELIDTASDSREQIDLAADFKAVTSTLEAVTGVMGNHAGYKEA